MHETRSRFAYERLAALAGWSLLMESRCYCFRVPSWMENYCQHDRWPSLIATVPSFAQAETAIVEGFQQQWKDES